MSRPVILLVPGAWHSPSGFSPLVRYLEQHGYMVEGIPLASVGAAVPEPNFDADVMGIASAIRKYVDHGSEVVILFHSYGGIPGSAACKGLLKFDREQAGEKGGIAHLVYCAALVVDEGASLMEGIGSEPLPWFNIAKDQKSLMPNDPIPKFYNDIHDEKVLDGLVSSLQPQSYGAFFSKATYAAWRDSPSTYILCERDAALPVEGQRDMVKNAQQMIQDKGGRGAMQEISMETGHSPFISRPEELGRIMRRIAGEKL
jgi:pimeloyl-ACP methyl ester carboxylesterase